MNIAQKNATKDGNKKKKLHNLDFPHFNMDTSPPLFTTNTEQCNKVGSKKKASQQLKDKHL